MNLYDWKTVQVDENESIKDALAVLDEAALQIALVVSKEQVLLGSITDGDVRRALLKGVDLSEPVTLVMNRNPFVGYVHTHETAWKKLLLEKAVRHLPLVDTEGRIKGLYHQKPKGEKRLNPVVLMLGGLGTRLRPLTETVPKPMLRVGDKPILEVIVKHIAEQGFIHFYFCINYLGEQIREYFGDGSAWGIHIEYVQEKKRMGTAGALSLLPEPPKRPFIVMNGDLLTKVDFGSLLDFHEEHENEATACVREYKQTIPYGVVEMNGSRIEQMIEKPTYHYFVNAGIYVLSPSALNKIPKCRFFDMPTLIEDLLKEQGRVGGFPIREYWMDIGHMPDFEQAQDDYDIHFEKSDRV